jgi:hypothetical protein
MWREMNLERESVNDVADGADETMVQTATRGILAHPFGSDNESEASNAGNGSA